MTNLNHARAFLHPPIDEGLRLSHYDVDPAECSVRRCIAPDEIGCIMGHAGKSSEFSFAAVFLRPEETVV